MSMSEQASTERITRLVRCLTLTNGAVFVDPMVPQRGECTVLDFEVSDDHVSALVLTEAGEQAVFERTGSHFVALVVR